MEPEIDAPFERGELRVDLAKLAANALDRTLEAHAIGLELCAGAVAARGRGRGSRDRREIAGARVGGRSPPVRVLDLPRELLDTRLVVAKVVLEVLALVVE